MPKMNSKPNIDIFKEPRGFIKIIEIFIAIFAFATAVGYSGHYEFQLTCPFTANKTISQRVSADFSYNFDHATYYFDGTSGKMCNKTSPKMTEKLDYKSESEYFVFVGVTCFLYALLVTVYYILFEDQVEDSTSTDIGIFSLPVVDFVVSVVYVVFWFTSSIAWAAGLAGLKDATAVGVVTTNYRLCQEPNNSCNDLVGTSYAALNVSVLLGFLNCLVWAFNLWFVFKETPWHSPRRAAATIGGPDAAPVTQETPPASAI